MFAGGRADIDDVIGFGNNIVIVFNDEELTVALRLEDVQLKLNGDSDTPIAALIKDLKQRGLLDSTLVRVVSEFGRTPKFNKVAGRDHWSRVFSLALAGGGMAEAPGSGRPGRPWREQG